VATERESDDPYQSRIDAYQRDLDTVAGLVAFATTLRDRLRAGLGLHTWSALSSWARELFSSLYGDAAALAQMPPEEQSAAVTVQRVLQGLADLDAFEPTADLRGLVDVLTLELESALPRVGRFGEGVLVSPLSAAVGLDVDVLYVVGLAEDSYPGRLAEDALLLERIREASAGELASYRDKLDAMHRHLLAAFDAAPRVVASFPRGDLRRSTGRLPSRWLLPTLRDLSGNRALAATEWETADSDRIDGSPSYALSLTSLTMPATEQEWRTRTVAAGLLLDDPVVDAGNELIRSRAAAAFGRFDGNLSTVSGLPDFADGRRRVSPTALEAYAICPHAYFVERLLRVTPVEQPEEIIAISPLDVGNLIHETMDEFVTGLAGSLPDYGQPWSAGQRRRLHEIAEAKAAEFEARGSTGHRTLWESERDRILADLDYMLDDDNDRRLRSDSKVLRSELSFGKDGQPPVSIAVDGGVILMRGSADLVEQTRDGTLVVIDIKTGSTSKFRAMKTDQIAAGTKLQLPVYAEAARQLLGGHQAEAAYWFVRQGKRDWIPVQLTDELQGRYVDAVGTLVTSIAGGMFPAKAPDGPDFSWVQCSYCNPDGLGHGEVRTRWERKRLDPALDRLVRLVDPGVLDDDGQTPEVRP
jgi:RecB family exonuclease